ncbi:MAG: hypothetical protein NC819_03635 [Candidatus Omnitrophica bacterium]|nr:hypothetical protein [Candidatus Omnitrophota bacterium]
MKNVLLFMTTAATAFPASHALAKVEVERLQPDEAPIEQRIASGQGVFWTLERRSISSKGQTLLDGVIVAAEEAQLRVRPIRRQNGDHRVSLGPEGEEGLGIAALQPLVKEMEREKMIPYRLDLGKEIVAVYIPYGADLKVSEKGKEIFINLEIPEDKRKGEKWNRPPLDWR